MSHIVGLPDKEFEPFWPQVSGAHLANRLQRGMTQPRLLSPGLGSILSSRFGQTCGALHSMGKKAATTTRPRWALAVCTDDFLTKNVAVAKHLYYPESAYDECAGCLCIPIVTLDHVYDVSSCETHPVSSTGILRHLFWLRCNSGTSFFEVTTRCLSACTCRHIQRDLVMHNMAHC